MLKMILCWWIYLSALSCVQAQSVFKVRAGALYAYNSENPVLNENEIVSNGFGFLTGLDFTHQPENWKFVPGIGIGVKQLYTAGTVGTYAFSGQSSRLMALIYLHYLVGQNWKIGVIGMAENNKDFADFRYKTNDQYRFNAGLEMDYEADFGLGAFVRYTRSIYPNENIYLINHPSDQIAVGIHYKFISI